MRQVIFKRWITAEYTKNGTLVPGTSGWSSFKYSGVFHQWAPAYEEFESGPGNYIIALIELSDGTIESVLPFNVKFIS